MDFLKLQISQCFDLARRFFTDLGLHVGLPARCNACGLGVAAVALCGGFREA